MSNLLPLFKQIKLFIFDVDGVLTDGGLQITDTGEHLRTFFVKDGWAINKAKKEGIPVAVISAGNGIGMRKRLEYLNIPHLHLGVKNKVEIYQQLINSLQIAEENVAYMGDDIPDLEVLKRVGLPCCPKDAVIDVINNSKYISSYNGGRGAVRDIIEKVLRVQDKWGIE